MRKKISVITALFLTLQLTLVSPLTKFVIADELINSQDLKQTIIDSAHSDTSSIHPDTSSSTQPASPPAASTSVANTGDNTTTNTSANNSDQTTVNNQNDTTVNQTVDAEADTGHNTANGNISINGGGAGLVTTGDATVNTTASVNAGSNTTGISGGGSDGGSSTDVANTGNGLTTNTNSNSTMTTIVNNRNTTIINQTARVSANTGYNIADGNIALGGGAAGVITTGKASTNTNFLVTAGGNVTLIGGTGGNGPGDGASIIMANTGNFGTFNTSSNTKHYTIVTNENRAIISQTCGYPISKEQVLVDVGNCVASTGGNTSNGNVAFGGDAGVIHTSDATVNVTMNADANHNTTVIQNGGGNGASADANVYNTGNNVDVNNSATSDTQTTVNNHNTAIVDQTVHAVADTGHNTANGNISFGGRAGVIDTGNATVNVTLHTDVNDNQTAVLGGSTGDGAGTATSVINTGDKVQVNNNSTSTNQTTVNNTNVLWLLQQVVSFVTTGFNSALGNIGSAAGIIHTGAATSNTNLDVKGNTNCTVIGGTGTECLSPTPTPAVHTQSETPNDPPAAVGGAQVNNPPSTGSGSAQGGVDAATTTTNSGVGAVLGLAVLPGTGPEFALLLLIVSLGMGVLGRKLAVKN